MKLKSILCTLSLALAGTFYSSVSAADKVPQPNPNPKITVVVGGASGETTLHSSSGLSMLPIGEHFFALLPGIPTQLETPQVFLEKRITSVTWTTIDSRNLGEESQFGLSLKSPDNSSPGTPSFVHVSGLLTKIEMGAKVCFEMTPEGNLVAVIGNHKHSIIKKEEMTKYAASSPRYPGTSGLATTTKKPATRQ
ncbi:MAG: hypothetical protein KBB54_04380 [Candidatus Pacebacteria bacterium]|jgi:hypothetical protein|nr:hypothetical protein [Candidatus Paceibacterota bacterium]MBP9818901.1 hypothetical protein [Candidatus Paceibacterota bacterium]